MPSPHTSRIARAPVARLMTRRARAGMTLIEVLVVIVIIAVAAMGMTYGLSMMTRTHLRSGCMTVAAGARYAYSRATSQGHTVRIVFDLDSEDGRMGFEEAHGRVTLARVDDAARLALEDEDVAAVDPWEAARARLNETLRPSFGASPFTNVPGPRFQMRPVGNGVQFERLIVPHEPDPRTEGQGAIYFFPGGQTQHAVIWLTDGRDRVYSVEIHPLTGRAKVHPYAFEPRALLDDGRGGSTSEVGER